MNIYKYVLFALLFFEYLVTITMAKKRNPSARTYAVITGYTAALMILVYNA